MPRVKIVGGGLAGLSAAVALASLDWQVDLYESKPFLGGRATSFPVRPDEPDSERIDNCQHVLLRCCDNLMDFYKRCGVAEKIRFYDELYFVRPGGAVDTLRRGALPYPAHLAGSFLQFGFLSWSDKFALAADLRALQKRYGDVALEQLTMAEWLSSRNVSKNSYQRFWRPILVSALNEEPERASARAAFQVFAEGLLGSKTSYEMGVPAVPLAELYDGAPGAVQVHLRESVERIDAQSDEADVYISAVPYDRVLALLPGLELNVEPFEHSPITGVHLWFDRPVTELPHAVLLDRTMQWMFRKSDTYVQCVVSASRDLLTMSRGDIIELARKELAEYFPAVAEEQLIRAHVVKEARATYSIKPGLTKHRPPAETKYANVFLAGDWTDTNWPATMEGAVRSGYRAAEAAARSQGAAARFLV
ncbi:MAG: hydroxysqualene dehydroxylase HpnE [Acidobacteria bacterium]|nr:hydroxysqualene dehydroxylase HpnE [Acidobacteriota bacterium]